jgi:hypothetical protein
MSSRAALRESRRREAFIGRSAILRISESDLSVRAKNVLQQIADLFYRGYDVINWSHLSRQGLLRRKHCGVKTANEILRYGVEHASPKQADRLQRILKNKRCPTCGRLP